MESISQHIYYLLLTCRNVSIPGLGSFEATYESALFDAFDGIFYPSRIRINFIPKTCVSSNLLTDSLKRRLKINNFEAEEMLNKYVKSIIDKINKQHFCRLEGIGYLINYKGKLIFKDTFWKNHKKSWITPISI